MKSLKERLKSEFPQLDQGLRCQKHVTEGGFSGHY